MLKFKVNLLKQLQLLPVLQKMFVAGCMAAVCLVVAGYRTGPGGGGLQRTGAPFVENGLYCTQCHGGGNFGASIQLDLLDATNTPVLAYEPNMNYTLRITLGKTNGNPKYGFQVMAVKTSNEQDLHNWGAAPAGTHQVVVGNRHYVEHSNPLTSGTIYIPWVSPPAFTGAVSFYAAGNIVNGTGGTDGDQPVKTMISFPENSSLPVRLTSFDAVKTQTGARLKWQAGAERGCSHYVVERSYNGRDFALAGTRMAANKDGAMYALHDAQTSTLAVYYRLKAIALDGSVTTFKTIVLPAENNPLSSLTVFGHAGNKTIVFTTSLPPQQVHIVVTDIDGAIVFRSERHAATGQNSFSIPGHFKSGMYFIRLICKNGKIFSAKYFQ